MKNPMKSLIPSARLKTALILAALVLCSQLTACGDDDGLKPLAAGDQILAFGDSLTAGKGTSERTAYPAVLESLSGYRVINAGISGETTSEGRQRLPEVLQEHDPELVILFEGGNDILQNLSASETKSNLADMIAQIKSHGAQLILVGVPEKSLFSSAAPWYAELAEEHQLPLQKNIVSKLLKKPAMKSDSVHFNEAGYRALAESIHTLLAESGAY